MRVEMIVLTAQARCPVSGAVPVEFLVAGAR